MTEAFTLDTSGAVEMRRDLLSCGVPAEPDRVEWSDLSPFAQGYVEALFASLRDATHTTGWAFRYLAPETLAAILKDCEAMVDPPHVFRNDADAGARCWRARQESWPFYSGGPSLRVQFPPITPYLDDTGKVRLREGQSSSPSSLVGDGGMASVARAKVAASTGVKSDRPEGH